MAQPQDQASAIPSTPPTNTDHAADAPLLSINNPGFFKSEFVTLLVGKDKTALRAHKDLLCAKSKFFKGCLDTEFLEAGERTVTLPDDDATAVGAFLIWACSGKFDFESYNSVTSLVEAYRFADKILAEEYCNDIVDSAMASNRSRYQYIAPTTCLHLYQADLQDTQLASYALKGIVYTMMTDNSKEGIWENELASWFKTPLLMENFTKELLRYRRKPYNVPSSWTGCHFHDHKEGSKCSASASSSK